MGKEAKLEKMLEKRGGLFGEGGITGEEEASKEVATTIAPEWIQPRNEKQARKWILGWTSSWTEYAYKIGRTLAWLKKDILKHGEFEAWVEKNIHYTPRQARFFMEFSRYCDEQKQIDYTVFVREVKDKRPKKETIAGPTSPKGAENGKTENISDLKAEVKTLESQAKEAEKNLEAERKAREKAEKLAQEAREKLAKEKPAPKEEKAPEARGGIESLTVELAPGFNRPKVEKTILEWFWKEQKKVRATRKQVTLHLEVGVQ